MSRISLPDAIRLGGTLGPQIFGQARDGIGGTCALQGALDAVGRSHDFICRVFPEAEQKPCLIPCRCPASQASHVQPQVSIGSSIRALVSHLNDAHHWSRERIADAVEELLAAEHVEQTEEVYA